MTVQIGNTAIDFRPLMVVFAILLAIIAFYIVQGIVLNRRCQKIAKAMTVGDYDYVIAKGERVLAIYQTYNKRRSSKSLAQWIEYLNFALGVSYFANQDNDNFLKHITALTASENTKQFWLSLYYIKQNEIEIAQGHYNQIENNEDTLTSKTFLESMFLYKNGERQEAKEKMQTVIPKLKHKILKQLADEI